MKTAIIHVILTFNDLFGLCLHIVILKWHHTFRIEYIENLQVCLNYLCILISTGLDFIIKDSVLIITFDDKILHISLFYSYKYNCCVCRIIGKLRILILTVFMNLSEMCTILHELFWIKVKPD